MKTFRITEAQLKDYFHAVLTARCYKDPAWRKCARFKANLTRYGGVKAMRRLLDSKRNWFKNQDAGAEPYVLKPQFKALFTDKERAEARRRIKAARRG